MPITPSRYVTRMRDYLRVVEPDLDTSVGSITRKILDSVGEAIAESDAEGHLLDYRYDIEAKTADDLDEFVTLFGLSRFGERQASGTLTFERQDPSPVDITIPLGTQVATTFSPPLVTSTTVPAVLRTGETSVSIPARVRSGGSEGNVAPNTLTRIVSNIQGISGVTNTQSFSGGRDAESDNALRRRFRTTIFQSLAGTRDMYASVALHDEDVTNINVIGTSRRFREQVDVISGTATSTVADARTIYAGSAIVGADIDAGDLLIEGVHYTFDHTVNPPTLTSLSATEMPDGVYDLDFEYEPNASRNDVVNGITNRVDVYLWGERFDSAAETLLFDVSKVFTVTAEATLDVTKFRREDGSQPVAGNYFIRYGFAPVVDPLDEDTLLIGGVQYIEGTTAFLVNDVTNEGYGPRSLSGVELVAEANGGPVAPTDKSVFSVSYSFNAIPRAIQSSIERWRLLATDVMVHLAKPIRLNLYLIIIPESGFSGSGLQEGLVTELRDFIQTIGFSETLQTSDLLDIASGVSGVDAVRFATSTDNATDYAIQRVANDETTVLETYADGSGRVTEVVSDDDELPVLNNVFVSLRANNSFHTGQ